MRKLSTDEATALNDKLNERRLRYANDWNRDHAKFEQAGVYEIARSYLDLEPGIIHLDIGSAQGHFLQLIQRTCPEAWALLGVEKNEFSLRAAKDNGVGRVVGDSYQVLNRKESRVQRVFGQGVPRDVDCLLDNIHGKIVMVCDDVRTNRVLSRVLGRRPLHSASLLLPGASVVSAYEAPFKMDTVDERILATRSKEVADQIRIGALRYATEKVVPSGKFVSAERYYFPPNFSDDDIDVFMRWGGRWAADPSYKALMKQWTPSEFELVNVTHLDNAIGYAQLMPSEAAQTNKMWVGVHCFTKEQGGPECPPDVRDFLRSLWG